MQVETYEVETAKAADETMALVNSGEYALLIEELGLTGQKSLVSDEGDIIPYRRYTQEEFFVFRTLFPMQTSLAEYRSEPIPLRVLQVAAHATKLGIPGMSYLEVWHPRDVKEDPILVAKEGRYSNGGYLLARWGTALKPFEELKELAMKKATAILRANLQKAKAELDGILADPLTYLRGKVESGETNPCQVYINIS